MNESTCESWANEAREGKRLILHPIEVALLAGAQGRDDPKAPVSGFCNFLGGAETKIGPHRVTVGVAYKGEPSALLVREIDAFLPGSKQQIWVIPFKSFDTVNEMQATGKREYA